MDPNTQTITVARRNNGRSFLSRVNTNLENGI